MRRRGTGQSWRGERHSAGEAMWVASRRPPRPLTAPPGARGGEIEHSGPMARVCGSAREQCVDFSALQLELVLDGDQPPHAPAGPPWRLLCSSPA